jgi:cysteine desulfurase|tara:strand:+ start:364 stop:1299 length:936 start_codon:yes stop_codon:yes gene_type:complete
MERKIWLNHLDGTSINPVPSKLHDLGMDYSQICNQVSEYLGGNCKVILTSSGIEAVNHAIKGVAFRQKNKVAIKVEEGASLAMRNTVKWLRKNGFNEHGEISITCMSAVDSATGEIYNIEKSDDSIMIVDGCAAMGRIEFNMEHIDLLALQFDGFGALAFNPRIRIDPLIHGGGEQGGRRGGHIPAILLQQFSLPLDVPSKLDSFLLTQVEASGFKINAPKNRAFGIINVSLDGVSAESVLIDLAAAGVYMSASSGCTTSTGIPDASLLRLGLSEDEALSSLRISISENTTESEIVEGLAALNEVVARFRN